MRKLLDFSAYKLLKRMSFNDLNRWVVSIYKSGFEDGLEEAEKDTQNEDVVAQLTDERLLEIILSVKGIGKNRASAVVEKVLSEGLFNGSET